MHDTNRRNFMKNSAVAVAVATSATPPIASAATSSSILERIQHDVALHLDVLRTAIKSEANTRSIGLLIRGQETVAPLFLESSFADMNALSDLEASLAKGTLPSVPRDLNSLYGRTMGSHVTVQQGGLILPIASGIKVVQHDHIFDLVHPAVYFAGGMLLHEPANVIAPADLAKMTSSQLTNRGMLTASTVATKLSTNQVQLVLSGALFNNQSLALNATLTNNGWFELDLATAAAPRFGSQNYHEIAQIHDSLSGGGPARLGLFSWFKKVVSKVAHVVHVIKSTISRWISVIPKPIVHWITDRISSYIKGKLLQLLPQAAVFA